MSPRATPGRATRFALVAAGVLALHAVLWWQVGLTSAEDERVVPAVALAVRSIESLPPAAVPAPLSDETAAQPLPTPPVQPRERAPAARSPSSPRPAGPVVAPPVTGTAVLAQPATRLDAPPPAGRELPVYPTRLAGPARWSYRFVRGDVAGDAVLDWQPDAEQHRYVLRLTAHAGSAPVLDWASTGLLDGSGVAPERFAIRRRGRDSMAANFQRDAGKITWSGPTHEVPLAAGAQDRLSWMVQLPAVLEASPGRYGAGAHVVLMVIGARGGADVWTFEVEGTEVVDGAATTKLVRHPSRPHDVQVQAWLDPARGHLPVRVLVTQLETGTPFELRWQPGNPDEGSTGP